MTEMKSNTANSTTKKRIAAKTKTEEPKKSSGRRLTEKVRSIVSTNTLVVATVATLCVIALGVFWGWYNNRTVPINSIQLLHYTAEPHNPLSFLANWDGSLYLQLAKSGYATGGDARLFPLYPAFVGTVHELVPSFLDSGLIISWLSFIGASYFYLKILKRLYNIDDNVEALRGLLFFVLFPTGIFLIATFTESLFAFLALGSIYFALQKKFLPSALFAMFSTATHVNGLAVLLFSVLILLEQREKPIKILATAVIGSLGILSYMYALATRYASPFLFIKTQTEHGWLQHGYSNILATVSLVNGIFLLGSVLAAIYWWPRRKSFALYSLTFLCIPLIGRQFGGFNRYMLMAFPLQLMLYEYLRDRRLGYALAAVFFGIFWMFFTLQFAGGYVGG